MSPKFFRNSSVPEILAARSTRGPASRLDRNSAELGMAALRRAMAPAVVLQLTVAHCHTIDEVGMNGDIEK